MVRGSVQKPFAGAAVVHEQVQHHQIADDNNHFI